MPWEVYTSSPWISAQHPVSIGNIPASSASTGRREHLVLSSHMRKNLFFHKCFLLRPILNAGWPHQVSQRLPSVFIPLATCLLFCLLLPPCFFLAAYIYSRRCLSTQLSPYISSVLTFSHFLQNNFCRLFFQLKGVNSYCWSPWLWAPPGSLPLFLFSCTFFCHPTRALRKRYVIL